MRVSAFLLAPAFLALVIAVPASAQTAERLYIMDCGHETHASHARLKSRSSPTRRPSSGSITTYRPAGQKRYPQFYD